MNWFKKKPKNDYVRDDIEIFAAFRDIGQSFNYLGRKCIVTSHYEIWPCIGVVACLTADYANEHGEIKKISFALHELAALKAENP